MNTIKDLISNNTDKYYKFYSLLTEWNEKMNLTAITDEYSVATKHFLDCMAIFDHVEFKEGASVIDVGCGAGFPSLPLAIARPDLKITALDSTEKRIRYVSETAQMLGLTNIVAVVARAEEYAVLPENRECFDYATARAVASLPILCELTIPFVKVGGKLVAMKAKGANDEFEASRSAIRQLAGANSLAETRLIEKTLVGDIGDETINENRTIVVMNKLSSTNKRFPRKFAQIKKTPL